MALTRSLQVALLTNTWDSNAAKSTSTHLQLVEKVVSGDHETAFISPEVQGLLKFDSGDLSRPLRDLLPPAVRRDELDEDQALLRLIVAIICLNAFVQLNWTGPDLPTAPYEVFGIAATDDAEKALNAKAVAELSDGGEPAYHLARAASFLRIAQIILDEADLRQIESAPWWRLRFTRVHQHVLDDPVPFSASITSDIVPLYDDLCQESENRDLAGRLSLEHGLLWHHVGRDRDAGELFVKAARQFGLQYELTGVLGKRTKFQQTDVTQLVLLAESRQRDGDDEGRSLNNGVSNGTNGHDIEHNIPETLALNDDTLLEATAFTSSSSSTGNAALAHLDPSAQPALHPLDQCVFLSLCLNVKNTSPAHGLTSEQMKPYISRVISHPRNWSVHTIALLLRARLESDRTRTVERATLQLQALIEQMPTSDSSLNERLRYFYCLPMPSKWEMEKELATRFLSLGVVRSALEVFERLEMWEEAVKCYQALEKPEQGIKIVRDLLEGRKEEAEAVTTRGKALNERRRPAFDSAREAKLWCLLGDLEPLNALTHYKHAWEVSGCKSGRAMRSIGFHHFATQDFDGAIECLKKGAEINPLLSRPWFVLGCAAVKVEKWAEAREAFGRCVKLDEEDGESWSNLASVYLRMGEIKTVEEDKNSEAESVACESTVDQANAPIPFENKILAFRALQIGLKHAYDNWRMWGNYMLVALDVGEFAECARAMGRVVEERAAKDGADCVDEDVLAALVDAVIRAPSAISNEKPAGEDSDEKGLYAGEVLRPRILDLFERTLLPRVSSRRIYMSYARLLASFPPPSTRYAEALKYDLDAYRLSWAATVAKGEEVERSKWVEGVGEVEEIVDLLRNFGPRAEEEEEKADGSDGKQDTQKGRWKMQARSIVRTFMARTRELFEDDPEWGKLEEVLDGLKH